MPYVPPHLRKNYVKVWKNTTNKILEKNNRNKSLIVPKIGNKFVIFQYAKVSPKTGKKNLTFPGGGCKKGENRRNCARRELAEETGIVVTRNKLKHSFYFPNAIRENYKEINARKGLNVTNHYHGYLLPLNLTFNNIVRTFRNSKIRNRELNNVYLMSRNNLNKSNRLYKFSKTALTFI